MHKASKFKMRDSRASKRINLHFHMRCDFVLLTKSSYVCFLGKGNAEELLTESDSGSLPLVPATTGSMRYSTTLQSKLKLITKTNRNMKKFLSQYSRNESLIFFFRIRIKTKQYVGGRNGFRERVQSTKYLLPKMTLKESSNAATENVKNLMTYRKHYLQRSCDKTMYITFLLCQTSCSSSIKMAPKELETAHFVNQLNNTL